MVKTAVKYTDKLFTHIKTRIKPGVTEKQIAREIFDYSVSSKYNGVSFEPIVASGTNSAMPHYVTSNNKITSGILLIDAGIRYKGYNGDITRTYYLGKLSERFVKTYNLILNSQLRAINSIKPGVTEEAPWRKSISQMKEQSKYFLHGLGHGIGLNIHEGPLLKQGRENKLKPGMITTVEPGLYYNNWGGIRV